MLLDPVILFVGWGITLMIMCVSIFENVRLLHALDRAHDVIRDLQEEQEHERL